MSAGDRDGNIEEILKQELSLMILSNALNILILFFQKIMNREEGLSVVVLVLDALR